MIRRTSLLEMLAGDMPRTSHTLPTRKIRREVNHSQNKTEFTIGLDKSVLQREGLVTEEGRWVPEEGVLAEPEMFVTDEEVVIAFRLPRVDVIQERFGEMPDQLSIADLEREPLPAD